MKYLLTLLRTDGTVHCQQYSCLQMMKRKISTTKNVALVTVLVIKDNEKNVKPDSIDPKVSSDS